MEQEAYEFTCRAKCVDSKDMTIKHKEATMTVTGSNLEQAQFKVKIFVANKFSKGRVQAKKEDVEIIVHKKIDQ